MGADNRSNDVVDVRVALPADWWVVPLTNPAERQHAERALLDRQFGGRPEGDTLRTELASALTSQTSAAAATGARLLALSLQQAAGVPIPASLVLHWLDDLPRTQAGELLAELEDELRPEPGAEPPGFSLDLALLPSGRALRRLRVEASSETWPESFVADYWVERPDGGLVHLAFATPVLPLREALLNLFDAVAGALRWVRPVPRNDLSLTAAEAGRAGCHSGREATRAELHEK